MNGQKNMMATEKTRKVDAKSLRAGLVLATALLVAGCGSANAPSSEMVAVSEMAPGSWVASREARAGVDNAWVRRFGDPRLTRLVAEAIASNPDIKVAEARVREAVVLGRKAQSPALPQASGGLSGRRNKQNFVGFPDFGGGPGGGGDQVISTLSNTFGASLDVSWEPDIWGKVAAANAAEIARIQAEGYALRAARASLAGQMVKAWLALGEANEQLALSRSFLDIRKKTLDAVQERFAAALVDEGGTASQLRLVRTNLANAKQTIVQRQAEVARAKRQVELLAARYPSGLVGRGGVALPRLLSKPPAGLPSELLKRRPDLLEAERRYAASLQDATEADLARFPSLSLTSSAGRSSSEIGDLIKSDFGVWSLAGNLTVPILNGGRLKADYEASQVRSGSALATLQGSVLKAFGEVEQALIADEFLDRQIAAGEVALAEAVAADEASARDYADGVETILNVLEARGSRTQIATQLVTLRRQRLENRVNLHLALGGDFQLRGK